VTKVFDPMSGNVVEGRPSEHRTIQRASDRVDLAQPPSPQKRGHLVGEPVIQRKPRIKLSTSQRAVLDRLAGPHKSAL